MAFENSNNFPGGRGVVLVSSALRFYIEAHENVVVVHGRPGGGTRNSNLDGARFIGHEKSAALSGDLDTSGCKIGFLWKDITAALDAGNLTGALQGSQSSIEFLLFVRLKLESLVQFESISGQIVLPPE